MNKRKEITYCSDTSGDGAIYLNGKIIYAGHYCDTNDAVDAVLEALNCDVEEIEVSSEWACWILEVYPNAPFSTKKGYEWPDKLEDVETDLDWTSPK